MFGMGTGVSLSLRPPENFPVGKFWLTVHGSQFVLPQPSRGEGAVDCGLKAVDQRILRQPHREFKRQALRFVNRPDRKNSDQVARLISIARLNPLLDLHLRPINPVVYREP